MVLGSRCDITSNTKLRHGWHVRELKASCTKSPDKPLGHGRSEHPQTNDFHSRRTSTPETNMSKSYRRNEKLEPHFTFVVGCLCLYKTDQRNSRSPKGRTCFLDCELCPRRCELVEADTSIAKWVADQQPWTMSPGFDMLVIICKPTMDG